MTSIREFCRAMIRAAREAVHPTVDGVRRQVVAEHTARMWIRGERIDVVHDDGRAERMYLRGDRLLRVHDGGRS